MCAWQEYDSLPAGNWTFAVMAADAAGNAEAQPQSAAPWQVDMAAFVQISGGDAGATVTRQAHHATQPLHALAGGHGRVCADHRRRRGRDHHQAGFRFMLGLGLGSDAP